MVTCYLNCYSRPKYFIICWVSEIIKCNCDNVAPTSKSNKQTQQSAVSGLSWSSAVKRQVSAFTVTCICATEEKKKKKKKTEHKTHSDRVPGDSVLVSCPNELARSGIKRAERWRERIAMTRIAGHHSHSAELERSLCSGIVLCLSVAHRRCPSYKVPLIMKAQMKFSAKVFCFSFSCRIKKNKRYFLLHLTFKSQHCSKKKKLFSFQLLAVNIYVIWAPSGFAPELGLTVGFLRCTYTDCVTAKYESQHCVGKKKNNVGVILMLSHKNDKQFFRLQAWLWAVSKSSQAVCWTN